jgi:hypothetical protein
VNVQLTIRTTGSARPTTAAHRANSTHFGHRGRFRLGGLGLGWHFWLWLEIEKNDRLGPCTKEARVFQAGFAIAHHAGHRLAGREQYIAAV